MALHGRAGYKNGCRCPICEKAHHAYLNTEHNRSSRTRDKDLPDTPDPTPPLKGLLTFTCPTCRQELGRVSVSQECTDPNARRLYGRYFATMPKHDCPTNLTLGENK